MSPQTFYRQNCLRRHRIRWIPCMKRWVFKVCNFHLCWAVVVSLYCVPTACLYCPLPVLNGHSKRDHSNKLRRIFFWCLSRKINVSSFFSLSVYAYRFDRIAFGGLSLNRWSPSYPQEGQFPKKMRKDKNLLRYFGMSSIINYYCRKSLVLNFKLQFSPSSTPFVLFCFREYNSNLDFRKLAWTFLRTFVTCFMKLCSLFLSFRSRKFVIPLIMNFRKFRSFYFSQTLWFIS